MNSRKLRWDAKLYQDNSFFQYKLALMAIEKLRPRANERILDIGCGNALATIELAGRVPGGEVVAVEVSPEMCAQARENIKKAKTSNIKVIQQDAFTLDYRNEFDAVFSNSSIHWISDLEAMYRKIYNALKNGGRIIVQTALKDHNALIDTTYRLLEIADFKGYFKGLKLPWRFLGIDENVRMLESVNYRNISAEPYTYRFRFEELKGLKDFFKSAALIPFLSVLPEEEHEKLTDRFIELYFDLNMSRNLEVEMHRVFIQAGKRR